MTPRPLLPSPTSPAWIAAALAASVLAMQPAPAQNATTPAPIASAAPAQAPTLVLPDGGKYYGPLKDGLLEGQGRLVWNAVRSYQGDFHQGRMEGQGQLILGYGMYQGQFKDGDLNGPGRYTSNDGERYEGGFVDGEYDGQGVLTSSNGNRYEGRFAKGQFVQGTLTDGEGQTMTGAFKSFQPDGVMEVSYPGGIRFKGEMRGMDSPGKGELHLPDGKVVSADFAGDQSEAEIRYPNGDRYTGAVYGAAAFGKGRMVYANGDVYEGQFAKDKPHGQGTMTPARNAKNAASKTSLRLVGQWRNGKYLAPGEPDSADDNSREQAARTNEQALYAQNALLAQQMAALQPSSTGRGGTPQMYALFIAGDGSQEVFRREVEYVSDQFAKRYGTTGRSMLLANSRSSVARLPLATTASIERALGALGQKMDKERDLLFVFLTSHGSREHDLQLGMRGLHIPQLPAKRLGELLKASGIRKKVVVVSACYSGGFIAPLQSPTTWVITASRADRTSFGCADENDFTYFGRALFKESLPQAANLSDAFAKAQLLVQAWEAKLPAAGEGRAPEAPKTVANTAAAPADAAPPAKAAADKIEHSEPQMAVQPAFQAEVDAWFAGRQR